MPRETLECLLAVETPVRFIRGNGEADALAERSGAGAARVPEAFRRLVRWSAEQFAPEHVSIVASWPGTLRLDVDGLGRVLFCHATPRDDNEIFTEATAEERLLPVFADLGVSVVVCGHTHMPFDRLIGGVRVVNAGSVGMPFGQPGADWLLLSPGVQLRHTDYDLRGAAERIRGTDYPGAEAFVSRYVLDPPSKASMLDAFSRAELH
jgi:predicted phosphodiesterase